MTDCINCSPEHYVFQAFMPMRAHDDQIGLQLLGIAHDLFLGDTRVPNHHFHRNLLILQLTNDPVEVLVAGFHLGGR